MGFSGGAVFLAFCPENFRPPLFLWRGNSHLREVRLLERRCTVFPLGLGTGFFFFRGWGSVFCFCVWGFVFVWGFITIDLSSSQDLFLLAVSFRGFLFVGRPLLAALWVASNLPWRAPWFFPFFIQPFFCFVPPTVFQLWKTSALVHLRA